MRMVGHIHKTMDKNLVSLKSSTLAWKKNDVEKKRCRGHECWSRWSRLGSNISCPWSSHVQTQSFIKFCRLGRPEIFGRAVVVVAPPDWRPASLLSLSDRHTQISLSNLHIETGWPSDKCCRLCKGQWTSRGGTWFPVGNRGKQSWGVALFIRGRRERKVGRS